MRFYIVLNRNLLIWLKYNIKIHTLIFRGRQTTVSTLCFTIFSHCFTLERRISSWRFRMAKVFQISLGCGLAFRWYLTTFVCLTYSTAPTFSNNRINRCVFYSPQYKVFRILHSAAREWSVVVVVLHLNEIGKALIIQKLIIARLRS